MKYKSFDNSAVEQLDDYCVNALEKELDYLASFDMERFLAGFRENAGLPLQGATRYPGWEDMLIGGHTVGHYLTAVSQAIANPGTPENMREKLKGLLGTLVHGMRECQKHSRGKSGFVFAGKVLDPTNVEQQFDYVEQGKCHIITEAWVPWYTMHKILAGLVDTYRLTGLEEALEIARGIGDWTYDRAMNWSEETHRTVLSIEYGGMNDALYELYAATGEDRYAVAAHAFDEVPLYEKVASGAHNVLTNRHANTTIPKFIGCLNRYMRAHGKTIAGEVVDASDYLRYAECFWEMVIERHTYITGANSEWEHFGADYVLDAERTNANNETCNVYNMLKLSRMLFEITGDVKYADYYERAFYNSILSSQNPQTGMTMYFQPMATGYFKVYGERFTKFWCCTGTGMENFTKLGDSIYFHDGETLVVNLYFSSKVDWKEKGVSIRQTADFPENDTAEFTIRTDGAPASLGLAFRIPEWTAGDAGIRKNGKEVTAEKTNGYLILRDSFSDGDVISVSLPEKIQAHPLVDNEASMAFTYGPVVLSADLGTEDETVTMTGVIVTIPEKKIARTETIPLPEGVSRREFLENVNDYFTRCPEDPDNLTFRAAGTDLVFGPHYTKTNERYGIYWYVKTPEEIAKTPAGGDAESVVDTVQPGYGQYESDELHAMEDLQSAGVTNDGTYRYAKSGGYFSYRMMVQPGRDHVLKLSAFASGEARELVIRCEDRELYRGPVESMNREEPAQIRIPVAKDLVDRAEKVTVAGKTRFVLPIRFEGPDGAESARVCDFIYMVV